MGKAHAKSSLLLEVESVSKNFGALEILKNVNLALREGESIAILGPSGAGKSTLLHIAGLMDRPTSGSVKLKGQDVGSLSDQERASHRLNALGFVFQFHYLLPDFNVLENVVMPCRLAGDDLDTAIREAKSILDRLGLTNRLDHKPSELSGGEQQRAGLARALVRHPQILLCDEPTGNLDQETAAQVGELIWSEVERNGLGAIIVTHNESFAKKADRSLRLQDGTFRMGSKN